MKTTPTCGKRRSVTREKLLFFWHADLKCHWDGGKFGVVPNIFRNVRSTLELIHSEVVWIWSSRVVFSELEPCQTLYRTGSIGNRPKPVEFKFQIKIRSSVGLVRYTDRFDRYTGPVRPITGCWNKKETESMENLTCFQIEIKIWKIKEIFLKILQGA
jgi:hypothetical protein